MGLKGSHCPLGEALLIILGNEVSSRVILQEAYPAPCPLVETAALRAPSVPLPTWFLRLSHSRRI